MDNAADCGIWGTRSDTPDSLQNIQFEFLVNDIRSDINEVKALMTRRVTAINFLLE